MLRDSEIKGLINGLVDSDDSVQYVCNSPKRIFINTTSSLTVFQLLKHIRDNYGYIIRVSIDRYSKSIREEQLRIRSRSSGIKPQCKFKLTPILRVIIHKKELVNSFLNIGDLNSYFAGLVAGDGYIKHRTKNKKDNII